MKHNASWGYRIAWVAAVALTSTWAYAVYCPPQYQENWVAPQFQSATAALTGAIQAVDASLSSQLRSNSQRLTSAIAVLTKQKAVAAHQIGDANRMVAQQTATALNALAQTERVKRARFDYGGEFGQGFSPCQVYADRNAISHRDAELGPEQRARVMSEIMAAPGRYGDPIQAQRAMIEAQQPFCTEDQVKSGLCKRVGSLPGANLTVATLFEPAMEGEPLYDAKVGFINTMAGLPDGAVPPSAATTSAAAAYMLAKARKDALASPALASLKAIQLDYSGVDSAHDGQDLPLAVLFRNEVKRYAGNSSEYDEWSRVMAAQNERGLLVELLRAKALDLAIQEKQYRQYERLEAQLAALVALEVGAGGAEARAAAAAEQTAREQAGGAIR